MAVEEEILEVLEDTEVLQDIELIMVEEETTEGMMKPLRIEILTIGKPLTLSYLKQISTVYRKSYYLVEAYLVSYYFLYFIKNQYLISNIDTNSTNQLAQTLATTLLTKVVIREGTMLSTQSSPLQKEARESLAE